MGEIEKIDADDREHWINTLTEGYIKVVNLSYIFFISVILSCTLSCFGPLVIKDKETTLVTQLYDHGIKPKNYWVGVLLSDSFYIMIPTLTIIYMTYTYLPAMDLFNEKLISLTVGVSILCIVHCLLYQYFMCYYLNNYPKVSRTFAILMPIITSLVYYQGRSSWSKVDQKDSLLLKQYDRDPLQSIEAVTLNAKPSETSNLLKNIFFIIFYAPSNFMLYLSYFTENIFDQKFSFKQEELDHFLASKADILTSKRITYEEKEALTHEFLNNRIPSLLNILFGMNKYTIIIYSIIVGAILSFLSIKYFEDIEAKKRKKEKRD